MTEVFKCQEKRVIIGSRRVKSLSLGRLPWISPTYFKKTQASKLGDAWHPLLHRQIIRSSLVKLYFYSFTSYVLFLERLYLIIYLFILASNTNYINKLIVTYFIYHLFSTFTLLMYYLLKLKNDV